LPASVRRRHLPVSFPRRERAALAARMRELHAGPRVLAVDEGDDPLDHLAMTIAPDAEIIGADPAIRRDGGRLGEHERRAADRAAAKMHEMPVVREAVD